MLFLGVLLSAGFLLVLGVSVWVFVKEVFTVRVSPAITHPVRFHLLHYVFQLVITLETWRLPRNFQELHDELQMFSLPYGKPTRFHPNWSFVQNPQLHQSGNLLEKMKICSMPKFFCFLQDRVVSKRNPGVLVRDLCFGTIPVRLFQPKAASCIPRRGIIFYHGGGCVFGGLDCYHNLCSFLARETDSVLLSVGYRKLPDYHHPISLRDCLNASIHFLKSLKTYGVDPSRVIICGESIGAAAVAIVIQSLLGRQDLPQPRAQVLIYPFLQAINFQLPSYQQNENAPFLSRKFLMTCMCKYMAIDLSWQNAMLKGACIHPDAWKKCGKWLSSDNIPKRFRSQEAQPEFPGPFNEAAYLETKQVIDAEVSPLIADDEIVAQLPQAFLVSCEYDVLRDDALLYKKRLEDQGIPVSWYHVEDGFHGCVMLFDTIFSFPCSRKVIDSTVSYIKGI